MITYGELNNLLNAKKEEIKKNLGYDFELKMINSENEEISEEVADFILSMGLLTEEELGKKESENQDIDLFSKIKEKIGDLKEKCLEQCEGERVKQYENLFKQLGKMLKEDLEIEKIKEEAKTLTNQFGEKVKKVREEFENKLEQKTEDEVFKAIKEKIYSLISKDEFDIVKSGHFTYYTHHNNKLEITHHSGIVNFKEHLKLKTANAEILIEKENNFVEFIELFEALNEMEKRLKNKNENKQLNQFLKDLEK